MKEKHIENLTKGKKSGVKIGSRNVPHRLKKHEQEKFSLAIKRKFLVVDFDSRENLINIWKKYCSVKSWNYVVVEKTQTDRTYVIQKNGKMTFDNRKEAVSFARSII